MGDTTLGVRCDDLTVNFRGDDILTLEIVVGTAFSIRLLTHMKLDKFSALV